MERQVDDDGFVGTDVDRGAADDNKGTTGTDVLDGSFEIFLAIDVHVVAEDVAEVIKLVLVREDG